ncbi:MAG: diheme cytochrome c-553 [Acidobacteria bacterium]|nr:MAG: diheme cytochrome c-553 [Acidobacteriota bacterium]REK09275.1 MAG: diheme cytochrome c-553 [Acidobacteriota bacterium]
MPNRLKPWFVVLLAAATLPLLGAGGGTSTAKTPADASKALDPAKVERGRYLTTVMFCNDCHTPFKMGENGPEPDMSRMLSGHPASVKVTGAPAFDNGWASAANETNTAWAGAWGVSFTANLTPDVETGLGAWSEDEFVAAVRSGRHRGRGRPILPPMPWPFLSQASDDDLSAIYTFLRSLPPISNRVPDPIPPAAN